MTTYSIDPIGIIDTCFPDKFGVPRQAGLAPSAKGVLTLHAPYNNPDCVEGLEGISHLWLTFIFHEHIDKAWKPKVRPPRLGGNEKVGVFATRSSFRPNHLGLSLVKLEHIDRSEKQLRLHLSGVDLVSGTPIVDIKPYLPYADNMPNAVNPLAGLAPTTIEVKFSASALAFCQQYNREQCSGLPDKCYVDLIQLIVEVLQQDPRPAYHRSVLSEVSADNKSAKSDVREYGIALMDCNVRWECETEPKGSVINVMDVQRLKTAN
jgi:tRNA-Thr(GGU) m(6)t(6)A37 methyltransferase TsaA